MHSCTPASNCTMLLFTSCVWPHEKCEGMLFSCLHTLGTRFHIIHKSQSMRNVYSAFRCVPIPVMSVQELACSFRPVHGVSHTSAPPLRLHPAHQSMHTCGSGLDITRPNESHTKVTPIIQASTPQPPPRTHVLMSLDMLINVLSSTLRSCMHVSIAHVLEARLGSKPPRHLWKLPAMWKVSGLASFCRVTH
jgi:hypothetical protein